MVKRAWSPKLKHALKTIALAIVGLCVLAMFLHRIVNPTDLNHCVVINTSGHDLSDIKVDIDCGQSRLLDGDLGTLVANGIRVINVPDAFFDGTITITSRNDVIGTVELRPPGRYGSTLVGRIVNDKTLVVGWNRIPLSENGPTDPGFDLGK